MPILDYILIQFSITESVFFDPSSGMDVSETSSSASSTNTQMMLQSPPQMIDTKPAATLLQQLQQQQQANSQQQFGAVSGPAAVQQAQQVLKEFIYFNLFNKFINLFFILI